MPGSGGHQRMYIRWAPDRLASATPNVTARPGEHAKKAGRPLLVFRSTSRGKQQLKVLIFGHGGQVWCCARERRLEAFADERGLRPIAPPRTAFGKHRWATTVSRRAFTNRSWSTSRLLVMTPGSRTALPKQAPHRGQLDNAAPYARWLLVVSGTAVGASRSAKNGDAMTPSGRVDGKPEAAGGRACPAR